MRDVLSRVPAWAEKFLAILVAAAALTHLALVGRALATSSLTTDEFGTIFSYSAKGPKHVVTSYNGPKNHVLFNLVNALTPGRESIAPLRARLFSFLATAGVVAVIAAFAFQTRRWLESAAWLAAWTASAAALEMGLLARGYGFLALAAAASCLATVRYFETRRIGWAATVGLATVAGAYTIPGYLFFGGPLLLALWIADRRRAVFLVGLGAAVALLALYAPLLGQLVRETGDYSLKTERDFGQLSDLLRAARVYGPGGPNAWLTLWLLAGTALAFLVPRTAALRCVAVATLAFFSVMLWLQTPPLRMAAFAMIPLAFVATMTVGELLRRLSWRVPAAFAAAGLALLVATKPAFAAAHFRHLPLENWADAAALIDAAFPRDIAIDYGSNGKYLKYYLAPGRPVRKDAGDEFASSGVLIIDASRLWVNGQRNRQRQFSAAERDPRGIELAVPGAWRDVVVNYAAPRLEATPRVTPAGVTAEFLVPNNAHAAVLTFDRPLPKISPKAEWIDPPNVPAPAPKVLGNSVVILLGGSEPGALRLTAPRTDANPIAAAVITAEPRR